LKTIDPPIPEADLLMEVTVLDSEKIRRVIRSLGDDTTLSDDRSGTRATLDQLQDLHARFLYFHKRPNKKLSKGLEAGVRVYRDGFRIEPFGSRTADWLRIAEKRAKRAGHAHVVPTRLFGFVEISRKGNPGLADTTSRQALLGTEAAANLVTVLREQLDEFEGHLRAKAEPRWKKTRREKAIAFEQARLHTLGVVSYGLVHEIRQPLQTIRSEADNIRAKLRQLEIKDEDISAAQSAIDRNVERIDKNIGLVSEISKGSIETTTKFDLVDLVDREVSLLRHRCEALGVKLVLEAPEKQDATLNEFVVYSVLVNYVQNSLDSISASETDDGTIRVIVQKKRRNHYIEVADDGPGVAAEVAPKIFKRFATKKTGGMGVGLYYCKAIVESHGGTVGFHTGSKGARFWMSLPEE
jgi:signal transduction histidine kinase